LHLTGHFCFALTSEMALISPFQCLYQGFDPAAPTSDYNAIPWRLGLLILSLPVR